MSILERYLEHMSIEELKERIKKLKVYEEHYRVLRQQSERICGKKAIEIALKEKGIKV